MHNSFGTTWYERCSPVGAAMVHISWDLGLRLKVPDSGLIPMVEIIVAFLIWMQMSVFVFSVVYLEGWVNGTSLLRMCRSV